MKLQSILKTLMKENDISTTALAKSLDIPISTLHGWLQGAEPKNIGQIKKVADYFSITVDELCFGISGKVGKSEQSIESFSDEINAGVFEVVLRRVKK